MTPDRKRSSKALFALVAALAAAVGCGPAVQPNTPVINVAPPAEAPAQPALVEAPEIDDRPPANTPTSLIGIQGVWEDLETLSHHTVADQGGILTVTSIVDVDGVPLEVRDVHVKKGALHWSYFVASTGYTVHLETERLEGDTLYCTWSNAESSGEQEFRRVK